jgi:hypothetical protein
MGSVRSCVFVVLLPLVLGGCERVYYQTHGFEPARAEVSHGVRVELVVAGTSSVFDTAGGFVERRGSPYRVAIYLDRPSPVAVEVLGATLVGQRSGAEVALAFSEPQPVGNGTLTLVAEAVEIALAFEEYEARIRFRVGAGDSAVIEERTLRLTTTYEESRAFRFWEEWMSV